MTYQITMQALKKVEEELERIKCIYPNFRSAHEAYGVLIEELAEVFDHVRKKPQERDMEELEGELVQVAAMSIKFIWWAREQRGKHERD